MFTKEIGLTIAHSVKDAPNYSVDIPLLMITNAIIVGKGTLEGNPTVDLKLVDQSGNEYLIMTTGGIIEFIAGAVRGVRELDQKKDEVKDSSRG